MNDRTRGLPPSSRLGSWTSLAALIVVIVIIVATGVYVLSGRGFLAPSPVTSASSSTTTGQPPVGPTTQSTSATANASSASGNPPPVIVKVSIAPGASTNNTSPGYSPVQITVVIGVNNTVAWTNNDRAIHTVTAHDNSFDSGDLSPGQTYTHTFTQVGTFTYSCKYHSWMHGSVIVEK